MYLLIFMIWGRGVDIRRCSIEEWEDAVLISSSVLEEEGDSQVFDREVQFLGCRAVERLGVGLEGKCAETTRNTATVRLPSPSLQHGRSSAPEPNT